MRMPPDISPNELWKISRADYDRMIEAGIFDEDDKVELLYGTLVEMTPQNDRHARCLRDLTELLFDNVPRSKGRVQCQLPLALAEHSEPEPDLAVLPPGKYRKKATTALLVIEISDSMLKRDRTTKAQLYAECGIPEYWVVNLAKRCVEVRTRPAGGRYRDLRIVGRKETVSPTLIPQVKLAVADFVP